MCSSSWSCFILVVFAYALQFYVPTVFKKLLHFITDMVMYDVYQHLFQTPDGVELISKAAEVEMCSIIEAIHTLGSKASWKKMGFLK